MSEKEIQKLSLATQIKKVIGNRILISSILLILIVLLCGELSDDSIVGLSGNIFVYIYVNVLATII